MNQKGEITLLSSLLIMVFTGLVLLSALELQKTYLHLQRRTHLFLCVKETKGEINGFLKFMGRSNWAIKNLNRLSLVSIFIPGLQKVSLDAQKAKKYLQYVQEGRVVSYLKTLTELKGKQCPLDPLMFKTPFKLGGRILQRDGQGAAILREEKWTYYYFLKPYFLSLEIKASKLERINPRVHYKAQEKLGRLSSHLSSL